jgi:glycosyltransferase involved in cell wall biosynthesis
MPEPVVDILFYALIHPDKRGSFEDFVCRLSERCRERNLRVRFLFCEKMNEDVRRCFSISRVDFDTRPQEKFIDLPTLTEILRSYRPKVVHLHFTPSTSPIYGLLKYLGGSRILITVHNSDSAEAGTIFQNGMIQRIKFLRRRLLSRPIDIFVGVSKYVADHIVSNGIGTGRVRTVYNGVDLERFSPAQTKESYREKLGIRDEKVKVATYVGQLIPEKGLDTLLEAATAICGRREDFLFLIAGDGILKERLIRSIRERGLDSKIRYLGQRSDAEDIYRASDVCICPSVWNEAFGLVLAEAMACGVPCVASRVGGIPEVVEDGKSGYLVPPSDPAALARAIEAFLDDDQMRISFSRRARQRAIEKFDLQDMVKHYIDLYIHLMER